VVESTSSAVDNFVYANMSHVEVIEGTRKVILKGFNPSDCFEFDRVDYVSNLVDTYSVLPVMRQIRATCPLKMVPFAIEADVPRLVAGDQVLLHVRSMNGKSVNTLFDNR